MAGKNPLHPIPHPARKPIVGNLLSIGSESPVLDMWKIAQELGGIYWLDMPGMPVIVISDHKLVDELCDEKRFDKSTNGALRRLRAASHGLFTADTDEPIWTKPHNILLANFSQRAMRDYHPMMLDIAEQLIDQVVAPQPRRGGRRLRDMTAADARHHRPLRLRLPLQLLLPRGPAPVRRRDGADARRRCRTGAACRSRNR